MDRDQEEILEFIEWRREQEAKKTPEKIKTFNQNTIDKLLAAVEKQKGTT